MVVILESWLFLNHGGYSRTMVKLPDCGCKGWIMMIHDGQVVMIQDSGLIFVVMMSHNHH